MIDLLPRLGLAIARTSAHFDVFPANLLGREVALDIARRFGSLQPQRRCRFRRIPRQQCSSRQGARGSKTSRGWNQKRRHQRAGPYRRKHERHRTGAKICRPLLDRPGASSACAAAATSAASASCDLPLRCPPQSLHFRSLQSPLLVPMHQIRPHRQTRQRLWCPRSRHCCQTRLCYL